MKAFHVPATTFVLCMAVLAGGLTLGPPAAAADEPHGQTLSDYHVAFLVGEGFMDSEALMPMGYLANRGARTTTIGLEPGVVTAVGRGGWTVHVEKSVDDVDVDQFDALVIPGGESPAHLRRFYETGKPVAAVCHGPQLLMEADLLEGVTATCVPSIVEDLKAAGAHYVDKPVVQDGHFITSRTPDDLRPFAEAIEAALLGISRQGRE